MTLVLGITVSDGIAGALIGASAVLLAGIVERRRSVRRQVAIGASTQLPVQRRSAVLIGDLGVHGSGVFRKSIWYHLIGVPEMRRLQRQSMRLIAEARSDLAMLKPEAVVLDAADELLEAISGFIAVVTAEGTPAEGVVSESIKRVSAARRQTLLDASAKKRR